VIRFLCGCTSKMEPPISEDTFKTFDSVVLDGEGFMVCLIHHQRRYGWRSLPSLGPFANYRFSSWTPLEIERFFFFGEMPAISSTQLIGLNRTEDRRDNRDPAELGRKILARKNGDLKSEDAPTLIDWPKRSEF
jgi:hypothetical protein